ncbi:MAG: hypothetical protein L6W00_08705 [Lentisphaeria bacterium]|nr:MAG: hypothetical protein L6W00_08705 [Lentisphaeria bacterium]
MMRYLLSLCSIAVALSAGAGGIAMKTGEWQFILDPQNGNLENIFYRNERIFPEASPEAGAGQAGDRPFRAAPPFAGGGKALLPSARESGSWRRPSNLTPATAPA